MAVLARGKFHHNTGWAPALVLAQYDASGNTVPDVSATAGVDNVDVILLGFANGKRESVTVGTTSGEFEFVDTV